MLGNIDLYKVGHHGSCNATPRSLFALWGGDQIRSADYCLLSTLSGVHGESEATRDPRETLVVALERRTELHSTEGLDPTKRWVEVSSSTSGESDFVAVD